MGQVEIHDLLGYLGVEPAVDQTPVVGAQYIIHFEPFEGVVLPEVDLAVGGFL